MVVGGGPAFNGRPRTKMRAGKGSGTAAAATDKAFEGGLSVWRQTRRLSNSATGFLPQGDAGGAGRAPAGGGGGVGGEGLRRPRPHLR